jgi:hypothetical protein
MSDQGTLPLGLAQQKAAKNIDPEHLESMGKRAAALFGEGGRSLNESVVEIVKEARLAPEQVKRVCEFANTSAYLQEFEKSGEQKNVTFDGGPANPSVVLKELNDGSSPAIHQVKTAAYLPPKNSYRTVGADSLLSEAFGVTPGMDKAASEHSMRANPGEEIADLKVRLEGVRDDLKSKYASSGVLLHDIRQDLCESVRQEVLGGTSLMDIGRAWHGLSDTPMWKEAMDMVSSSFKSNGMEKQASLAHEPVGYVSQVPNLDHPAIDRFLVFTKIAFEHRKLERALEIVDEQISDVNNKLRSL